MVENTWFNRKTSSTYKMDFGWGNGYVAIPAGRRFHGIEGYKIPVCTEGGITYSGFGSEWGDEFKDDDWVIGFDTAHYNQTLAKYSKEKVLNMTMDLRKQVIKLCYPLLD